MTPDLYNASLCSFIEMSPTPFHATAVIKKRLSQHGFTELDEGERWRIERGKRYYITRNGALIAFTLSRTTSLARGFRMIGAHTDSPSLQIKPHLKGDKQPYLSAGIEKYGGALLHTWFDRELSLAGRVTCSGDNGTFFTELVDFKKPLLYIPSLAIHLNRKANETCELNAESELSPVFGQALHDQLPELSAILLEQVRLQNPHQPADEILGFDLFCYDPHRAGTFGLEDEFLAGPRLDNLLSCHVGLEALCQAGDETNAMLICTNHEEVGSTSNSGALGNLPEIVISRILPSPDERGVTLHNSFLLSLDNAHATHPNFKDKSDTDHLILLNHGPVIKINAAQRYSSTSITASVFRQIASEVNVKTQDFVMRSDMPCGSTIGPLTSAQLGIAAVDVGAPTWAMHSIREVTGSQDPTSLYRTVRRFIDREDLPSFHL